MSFLLERGILHAKDGKLQFDAGAVAAAPPASVQSILNARVDRLAPKDRTLLQAASVIGKRFSRICWLSLSARQELMGGSRLCRRSISSVSMIGRAIMYLNTLWSGTRSTKAS